MPPRLLLAFGRGMSAERRSGHNHFWVAANWRYLRQRKVPCLFEGEPSAPPLAAINSHNDLSLEYACVVLNDSADQFLRIAYDHGPEHSLRQQTLDDVYFLRAHAVQYSVQHIYNLEEG